MTVVLETPFKHTSIPFKQTATPFTHTTNLLVRIRRRRKFHRVTGVSCEGDRGYVGPQVEQEGVQSCAQTHRGEDAQPQPPPAPPKFFGYALK